MERLRIWSALAAVSLLEARRRKDLYVAFILAILMVAAALTLAKFGVGGMEAFLKDATLTVINLFSLVLTVLFASRQIHEEVERRTLYPLLARPVERSDYLIGKFLGAWAAGVLTLVLFGVTGWVALTTFGIGLGGIFWQHLLIRAFALGVAAALTIMLALFLPSSATPLVALTLCLGTGLLPTAALVLRGGAAQALEAVAAGSYYGLPHLELFDLSRKAMAGWRPVGIEVIGALSLYAAVLVGFCGVVSAWRFERRAL